MHTLKEAKIIEDNTTTKPMENKKQSGGIGIGMVLFIIFTVLKLTGNIDWSWWWVTSPLWIPVALVMVISGLIVISHYNKFKD
jgi:hypothetical protein